MTSDSGHSKPESQAPENARSLHDIRASLAILSGFGEALETSFTELSNHMSTVMLESCQQDNRESNGQMKTLEADCRFCLSRIRMSATQLKERLEELDSRG